MGVDKITVHDNSAVAEMRAEAQKIVMLLNVLQTKTDALQTDVTQIKKDVKPTAEPIS